MNSHLQSWSNQVPMRPFTLTVMVQYRYNGDQIIARHENPHRSFRAVFYLTWTWLDSMLIAPFSPVLSNQTSEKSYLDTLSHSIIFSNLESFFIRSKKIVKSQCDIQTYLVSSSTSCGYSSANFPASFHDKTLSAYSCFWGRGLISSSKINKLH